MLSPPGFAKVNVPALRPGVHSSPSRIMIVTTAQLFKVAYGKFAIGAYNINNAEQTMGLFKGCMASKAPFIIQLSKGARSYTDKRMLEAIIRSAEEIFPEGDLRRASRSRR